MAAQMYNKKIVNSESKSVINDYMYLGKSYYQMAQAEKTDTVYQKEQYMNAEKVFTKVTEKEPENFQAYFWIANTYSAWIQIQKLGLLNQSMKF